MKRTVTVKNTVFGTGMPKICLPIVARNESEIREQMVEIARCAPDLIEFRADWFEAVTDETALAFALDGIRTILPNTPLLFTFRTAAEGGEKAISDEDYRALCLRMVQNRMADLIDVELFCGADAVRPIIEAAHEKGIAVVLSNHDFDKTPAKDELLARFAQMDALGGDLRKIAVMPRSAADVLTLLSATEEASRTGDAPVISMAMGALGGVSRLGGEAFGSCVTFGTAGRASAPGQIEAGLLRQTLAALHEE